MEEFEINGVLYKPIRKNAEVNRERKTGSKIGAMLSMLLTSMPITLFDTSMPTPYSRNLPDINLKEEYELIQNKKSNLSAWERDKVVKIFEENYEKV